MDEQWRRFESRIKEDLAAFSDVAVTRIPSHLERGRGGRTFRKKTDCDFAASVEGQAVFFDAKACGENRFNIKSLVLRDSKIHQYEFLTEAQEKGAKAGYLIWFYNHGKIMWFPVEKVRELESNEEKSVHLLSEEVRTQNDDRPITLKELIWGE